ncbi:hypothetical protein A7982_12294 [Minicystis rosea]|nr:Hypothetical protein A7982_11470 [Minicystis rosea]APR86945.1 hypothetical protein A7982_12294 [Minicystis rosea]
MPTSPDPVDTIERFAELSALLDDPFADEHEILHAFGLDAEAWDAIEARWIARMRAGDGDAESLARLFGKSYRETTQRVKHGDASKVDVDDTLPTGAAFLSTEAQPWRDEAATVGRDLTATPPPLLDAQPIPPAPPTRPTGAPPPPAVADTLETSHPLPVPPLPFHAPSATPNETLELGAILPRPTLPFTSSR